MVLIAMLLVFVAMDRAFLRVVMCLCTFCSFDFLIIAVFGGLVLVICIIRALSLCWMLICMGVFGVRCTVPASVLRTIWHVIVRAVVGMLLAVGRLVLIWMLLVWACLMSLGTVVSLGAGVSGVLLWNMLRARCSLVSVLPDDLWTVLRDVCVRLGLVLSICSVIFDRSETTDNERFIMLRTLCVI